MKRRGYLFFVLCLAFSAYSGAEEGPPALEVDIFVSVDCPIANAYAPEINRLYETFSPQGVRFRLVYPDTTLSAEEVAKHREEYALSLPGKIDHDHSLVQRAGASITPEVAVFDEDGKLRYRGKIDDLYSELGDRRRVATEKYLAETLRRLLAGEELEFREEKAIGCLIEPLPASD